MATETKYQVLKFPSLQGLRRQLAEREENRIEEQEVGQEIDG